MGTSAKQTTQAANEVALAKVAEVDAEIAQLDKVINEAQSKRDDLIAVRQALTPLISAKQQQLPLPRTSIIAELATKSVTSASELAASINGSANTGFRDAVRGALRAAPKGLKPAELIKVLEEHGDLARYQGKVKPADRVYSELHALKKSKEISRRYGRYVITPGETTHAQT